MGNEFLRRSINPPKYLRKFLKLSLNVEEAMKTSKQHIKIPSWHNAFLTKDAYVSIFSFSFTHSSIMLKVLPVLTG